VGQGFVLGKDRQGSVDVLSTIGQEKGFEVLAVGSEILHSKQISSSQIRQLIQNGEIDEAAKLLGRFFQVQGIVEKGDSRGRTIGFPTANLAVWPQKLIPAPGVYRCFTKIDGLPRLSVTNIGYRPTFADDTGKVFVEVHILDFDGDLYGKELQVQFTHRLRGEIKFPSFEGLVRQIQSDIIAARKIP
jgi:riboflavin kinase/FMN adenylyltransferase